MSDLSGVVNEQKATIETLRRRVAELEGERDRWKSAHCEMVNRNKLLRDRPDLPIERLQAYKQITAENAELKASFDLYVQAVERGRKLCQESTESEMAWVYKPDAIDLGKRLLKHFDVLPTKEEVDFIETTLLLRKLAMNSEREVEQCTATITKLRRLVGERLWQTRQEANL